jgi:hypothetical protein
LVPSLLVDRTLAIALVGAATGVGSLLWQVFTWYHARKAKVTVKVALGLLGTGMSSLECVFVSVANSNDYAVRVHSIGLLLQDGSKRNLVFVHQVPGSTIPGTVPPHDEGTAFVERAEVEQGGIDVFRPLVAWANLAAIGRVESKPVTLLVRADSSEALDACEEPGRGRAARPSGARR